jgi:hypothetical protein
MNVEMGTETPIHVYLFWEYLFRNFGILSLQCRRRVWGEAPHTSAIVLAEGGVGFLPSIIF